MHAATERDTPSLAMRPQKLPPWTGAPTNMEVTVAKRFVVDMMFVDRKNEDIGRMDTNNQGVKRYDNEQTLLVVPIFVAESRISVFTMR